MKLPGKCVTICWLCLITMPHVIRAIDETASCNGAFDVYFVLDKSSSLLKVGHNHFREETAAFAEHLADRFTSRLLRLSIVTFSDDARLVMALTSDRDVISSKLSELRSVIPDGMTRLDLGLAQVTSQIRQFGQDRASVVIILTDGKLTYLTKAAAVTEATRIRQMGATVITVGVTSEVNRKQLLEIVGYDKSLLFQAKSFEDLHRIGRDVIEGSCVEIDTVSMDYVCANETLSETFAVRGRGFNKSGATDNVMCRYWLNNTTNFLTTPLSLHANQLLCPSPERLRLDVDQFLVLQVSLNRGVSFISSNATITAKDCRRSFRGVWLMLVVSLFAIVLIWWFWNVICCINTEPKQLSAKRLPPPRPVRASLPSMPKPPTQLQQWPAVDASYYGGRGAGGINPMKVTWGDRGCTEAGVHLQRTKDAKEVRVFRTNRTDDDEHEPVQSSSRTCCLKRFTLCIFSPFVNLYKTLSLLRPSGMG